MKGLKHISLKEYSDLSENDRLIYDLIIKSTQANGKSIRVKIEDSFLTINPSQEDVWDLTYSDIIELKTAFADLEDLELTKEIARIVYQVKDITIVNVLDLRVFNWLVDAMTDLMKTEQGELAYEPTEKEKDAGIDDLERFDFFPTIDQLSVGDITRHPEILRLPYHKIFKKMAYTKSIGNIHKKIAEK